MIPNDPIHHSWSSPHPSFSDSAISLKKSDKLSDSFSNEFKNGFASIELCQFWIRLISSFLCDVAFLVELETVYFTQCMTNNYDVTIGASNSDSIRKKTSSKMNLATF